MNIRISPLLNVNVLYSMINPVKIQNMMSWIYVIMSFVLNDFLRILKKSNKSPIKIPLSMKIKNKYA